jgi:hypothetical protein
LGAPQFHFAVAESALLLHWLSLNAHPGSGALVAAEQVSKSNPQTMNRHGILPSLEIMIIIRSRKGAQ